MNDDQFTKLFRYIEQRFNESDKKMDAMAGSINQLANTLDAFAKRLESAEVEQAARDAQFARLLDWAKKVSKKTGIPLEGF